MTDINSEPSPLLKKQNTERPFERKATLLSSNYVSFEKKEKEAPELEQEGSPIKRDGMSEKHIRAYSICHYYNDMNSCVYQVYKTLYLAQVIRLDLNTVGTCYLVGQLSGGVSTVLTGILSDKQSFKTRIGKYMPFYIVGTIINILATLAYFSNPKSINEREDPANPDSAIKRPIVQAAFYISMESLLCIGRAAVQVSTISIANTLSHSNSRRDRLINNRNSFTYVANCTVLMISFFVFLYIDEQQEQFQMIVNITCILGFITSFTFVAICHEVQLSKDADHYDNLYQIMLFGEDVVLQRQSTSSHMSKTDWLKSGKFYIFAMVFALGRVLISVNNTCMAFYLIYDAGYKGDKENPTSVYLAIIPFVTYLSASIFCLYGQQRMTQYFGNRIQPTFVALAMIAISSTPLYWINNPSVDTVGLRRDSVYPLLAIQGVGISIVLNNATSCISDVIGSDTSNSAFVIGIYSFAGYVFAGVVLKVIMDSYIESPDGLKFIICIQSTVTAFLIYLLMFIGFRCYNKKMSKITSGRALSNKSQMKQKLFETNDDDDLGE